MTQDAIARTSVAVARLRLDASPLRHVARAAFVSIVCVAVGASPPATGQQPKRLPPALTLQPLTGAPIALDQPHEKPLVLLFVDTSQTSTRAAIGATHDAVCAKQVKQSRITWVILLSKGSDVAHLPLLPSSLDDCPPRVERDATRAIFGAFHIVALPAWAVIAPDQRLIYFGAPQAPHRERVIHAAILRAAGALTAEEFKQALHPAAAVEPDESARKAARHTALAEKLEDRGLRHLAQREYETAIETLPNAVEPRLGLAYLLLSEGEYDAASGALAPVFADESTATEAQMRLALVYDGLLRFAQTGSARALKAATDRLLRRDPNDTLAQSLGALADALLIGQRHNAPSR